MGRSFVIPRIIGKSIFFLFLFSTIALPCKAWRIEGRVLIIEKGDNLRLISHQLLGRGTEYDLIWKRCIDSMLSRDPNLIYEGMRFSIDSLLYNSSEKISPSMVIVRAEQARKEDKWGNTILGLSLIVPFLVAYFANLWVRKADKRKVTFDMLQQFNSSEMHIHRMKADAVLRNNLRQGILDIDRFNNLDELKDKDISDNRSVYLIMNFYLQLELLRQSGRLDNTLIWPLFGEIFYYWYDCCFNKYGNDTKSRWVARDAINSFKTWLDMQPERKWWQSSKKVNNERIEYSLTHDTIPQKLPSAPIVPIKFDDDSLEQIKTMISELLEQFKGTKPPNNLS